MRCAICNNFYDPEHQTPVCPHLKLDPPLGKLGGPRLRPELQREIDEAFYLRNKLKLTALLGSVNFAVRYYAQDRINRLEEQERLDRGEEPSLSKL